MSNRERRKGRDAEAEVRGIVRRHGFLAEALGGRADQADTLLVAGARLPMMLEVKRQETARPWAWWEQAETNAGELTPVVAFRRNRSDWLAIVRFEDLLELLK